MPNDHRPRRHIIFIVAFTACTGFALTDGGPQYNEGLKLSRQAYPCALPLVERNNHPAELYQGPDLLSELKLQLPLQLQLQWRGGGTGIDSYRYYLCLAVALLYYFSFLLSYIIPLLLCFLFPSFKKKSPLLLAEWAGPPLYCL